MLSESMLFRKPNFLKSKANDFLQYHRTPRECLKANDGSVPTECMALRNTFFECKRSMVSIYFAFNFVVFILFVCSLTIEIGLGGEKVTKY